MEERDEEWNGNVETGRLNKLQSVLDTPKYGVMSTQGRHLREGRG